MKNAVKYRVCWDILLMVPIYGTKSGFPKEKTTSKWTCPSSGLRDWSANLYLFSLSPFSLSLSWPGLAELGFQ